MGCSSAYQVVFRGPAAAPFNQCITDAILPQYARGAAKGGRGLKKRRKNRIEQGERKSEGRSTDKKANKGTGKSAEDRC